MLVENVESLIKDNFPDGHVIVQGGDGVHFEAVVVSDTFVGKKLLERQRLVYAAVGEYLSNGTIHALSLKTFTQQEWQEKCVN